MLWYTVPFSYLLPPCQCTHSMNSISILRPTYTRHNPFHSLILSLFPLPTHFYCFTILCGSSAEANALYLLHHIFSRRLQKRHKKKTESSSRCLLEHPTKSKIDCSSIVWWRVCVWRQPHNSFIEIIKFSGGSCNTVSFSPFSLKYYFDFARHRTKEFLLCIVCLNWLNGELTGCA